MKDFARYVILSPAMSGTAGPALQRTTPLGRSGVSFCESGTLDTDALGTDGKPSASKGARLGPVVRRPHLAA